MREPAFTLTAGPVAASPRVLAALGSQITYDYDPIFLERFRATQRKVASVFRTEGDVVLMQGEAVLGLEAAARGRRHRGQHLPEPHQRRLLEVVRRLAASDSARP